MKRSQKIMVACDCSLYSPKVMSVAAEMAEALDAEMVITNVINQRDVDLVAKALSGAPAEHPGQGQRAKIITPFRRVAADNGGRRCW